jgi:hypothetical protein
VAEIICWLWRQARRDFDARQTAPIGPIRRIDRQPICKGLDGGIADLTDKAADRIIVRVFWRWIQLNNLLIVSMMGDDPCCNPRQVSLGIVREHPVQKGQRKNLMTLVPSLRAISQLLLKTPGDFSHIVEHASPEGPVPQARFSNPVGQFRKYSM